MGNFGSLVFFGLAVGSVCATMIVNKFTWKQMLGISFLGNSLGLLLFSASSDYLVLCFARFFSGFN
jgi:predicted MFS family arabinose efflux permease